MSVKEITTPAGDPAWLVTSYDEVKLLLNDDRLRRAHPEPDKAAKFSQAAIFSGPMGVASREAADHAQTRMLLTPCFSARRMERLRNGVDALVDDLLDDMERGGAPADFHEAVSFPLPALVISRLLGVPAEDRAQFREWSDAAADTADGARSRVGWGQLQDYMRSLLERKRRDPGEDVLSDLVRAQAHAPATFTDKYAVQLAAGLLFAGHETTVAAIDRGMLLLLTHPAEREELQKDPARVTKTVEELLRVPNPVDNSWRSTGVLRYAASEITVAGQTIAAGDLVVLSLQEANLDPAVFSQPEAFNIDRDKAAHLTFGFGIHYCIGAPLARLELQALFGRVFGRFPGLQLAEKIENLRGRADALTCTLAALPVRW
jgi:pentalenolactone synthase